jgi:hypothetical protein
MSKLFLRLQNGRDWLRRRVGGGVKNCAKGGGVFVLWVSPQPRLQ